MNDSPHPEIFSPGFRYEIHKTITETDVYLWAGLTGEQLPLQHTPAFARRKAEGYRTVQASYLASLMLTAVSRLVAYLPPPGSALVTLTIHMDAPVFVGTMLVVVVTMNEWDAAAQLYWLEIRMIRSDGTLAATGTVGLRPHTNRLVAT